MTESWCIFRDGHPVSFGSLTDEQVTRLRESEEVVSEPLTFFDVTLIVRTRKTSNITARRVDHAAN